MNFKEEIEKFEQYDINECYIKKIGNIPIIFTAVHTMKQIRPDGSLKFPEPFTKAIALYIADKINCFYYVKTRDNGIDSNSNIEDEFKKALLDIIRKNDIKLLIDLHGAKAEREFDIEFGTLNGLTVNSSTLKQLAAVFRKNGVNRIAFNEPFKGGGISQYIYQNADIEVIQIEINQKFRDVKNIENIKKICDSLIDFSKRYPFFN